MRTMRARLTAWHSAVVGLLLTLFFAAAYLFMSRAIRARDDRVLLEAVDGLRAELLAEREDQPTDRQAAEEVVRELRFRGFAFVIYDPAGAIIAARVPPPSEAPADEQRDPPFDPAHLGRVIAQRQLSGPTLLDLGDDEGGYEAAVLPVKLSTGTQVVGVVSSRHEQNEMLEHARLAIIIALPIALLLSALGGSILARRSLAPMVRMRDRAAHISATNLGERLPIATPDDEVGRLATVINELLVRLEDAFAQQREFMADASHELRTPVAVVQNEASRVRSRAGRTVAEYDDALEVIDAAARRLRRVVDDLFLLARADAGDVPLQRRPLYLDEALDECIRSLRSVAEARSVRLHGDVSAMAPFVGDEELLRRLICNLLDNAIKYAPSGTTVHVRLERPEETYTIEVEDAGPGIPDELQSRIFDRFVRADRARAAEHGSTSGAGLGLSIARWIAEAHGGALVLVRSDRSGTIFRLTLPAPEPRASEVIEA